MKHSILVVDDNPVNLKLVASVLSPYYKLSITDKGEATIKIAELKMPDVILLDVMMPGISGFDVCRQLRQNEKTKDILIIFLTAKTEESDISMAFDIGGADYILKPFKSKEILSRIKIQIDLKEAQYRLKKQNEEMKEIIANRDKLFYIIAHDLKSPFSGILGMTEMVSAGMDIFSKDELVEIGKSMHRSISNVYGLIENLLDWARMQKGQIEFNPKEIDIYKIVEQSISVVEQRVVQKGITISNEVSEELRINADENMFYVIIRNLIYNAVKFTAHKGEIKITANISDGKEVIISVNDTGIGISADNLGKLFKIGETVKNKGTDGEPSTGLGLLLCTEYVKTHGGRIWAESEEGKGSTFHIALPIVV
ncbi:MAG: hybrid sensor histidine kinase/response regulator [Ignavibacteria bacterium]